MKGLRVDSPCDNLFQTAINNSDMLSHYYPILSKIRLTDKISYVCFINDSEWFEISNIKSVLSAKEKYLKSGK